MISLDNVKAWASRHQPVLLGTAVAGVAGVALYERNRSGADTSASQATPAAGTAGLTTPDTLATDIENEVQDELNTQQSYMNQLLAKLRKARKKNQKISAAKGKTKKAKPKKTHKSKYGTPPSTGRIPVKQLPNVNYALPAPRQAAARAVPLPTGAPRLRPGPNKRAVPR